MQIIFAVLLVVGQQAPRPPQAPSMDYRMSAVEQEVSKLKLELAELRADRVASQAKVGSVEVVSAREVHAFNPVKAAANVATAPLRAVGRTVCGTNGCVEIPSEFDAKPSESAVQTFGVQGDCSSGQCGMPTQRRGFFGRRRGW